jgi:hypothetical protein
MSRDAENTAKPHSRDGTSSDLELKHEKLACEWAHANGWLVAKLQWVGQTGWPDRTFIKNGRAIFIEFKRPKGGKRSKKQIWWVNQIKDHGGHAYFCTCAQDAISVLRMYG